MNKPLEQLAPALDRLAEALQLEADEIVRDAAIQRFEFCFELSWKAVQQRARKEGLDCASPRRCFEHAWRQGWLEEAPALAMISDRNLTSHTYNRELAAKVYSRLGEHLETLRALREALVA